MFTTRSGGYGAGTNEAVDVGVRKICGIREWDTCFPCAIIDAERGKIQSWSPIRNYWGDWTPTSVDQPCLIFTTNDSLPKSEFRNRMKILSMDVAFPSNPEDPNFHEAQEALTDVLERRSPILSYVARRMLDRRPWTEGSRTVEDVRRIVREFYDEASRPMPDYFPADEAAEKRFDTGRLNWQKDIEGGRVTFERESERIRAGFDHEDWRGTTTRNVSTSGSLHINLDDRCTSVPPRSSSNGQDTPSRSCLRIQTDTAREQRACQKTPAGTRGTEVRTFPRSLTIRSPVVSSRGCLGDSPGNRPLHPQESLDRRDHRTVPTSDPADYPRPKPHPPPDIGPSTPPVLRVPVLLTRCPSVRALETARTSDGTYRSVSAQLLCQGRCWERCEKLGFHRQKRHYSTWVG